MERLLDALTVMWSKGIIHRDIKSDNLILSNDGLKLVDFGVSKYVVKSSETMTGAIIGTYAYMSPEQMYGEKATWQSDLYSAGVVFWEMLTGNTAVTEVTELVSGETRPERINLEKETANIKKYLRGNPDLLGLDLKEMEAATAVRINLNVVALRSMMGKMQAAIIKRLENILKKMLANEVAHRYSDPNALKNDIAQLKALCQNYRDGTAVLLGIKGIDELPPELRVTTI
jgi:serine/threonine protein kinase